jgi:glutamate racemase
VSARGAKLLVVACNTASAVALEELRQRLPVPVIGLEPAIKPAVGLSRSGRIGVLATPRTSGSARLARLIATYAADRYVRVVPAPGLVELVEEGYLNGPSIEGKLSNLIAPLLADGVDTLVLGCTHYPFLRQTISDLAGPDLALIDSGEAVARRTRQVLAARNVLAAAGNGQVKLLTTGERARVAQVAGRLLGWSLRADYLLV